MALVGPSSPFVSSRCAPCNVLLLHPTAATGNNRTEKHHPKRSLLWGQSLEDVPDVRQRWGRMESWAAWKEKDGKLLGPWWQGRSRAPAARGANVWHVAMEFSCGTLWIKEV